MSLKILAPAKVNWFLEVLQKRPDGYHAIDTVMQAISLFDEITMHDAAELTLQCSIDLGPAENNLAYRAAALLRDRHAPGRGATIVLHKRIPHGAGLGGGSSDAAATVVALNQIWECGLGVAALQTLVSEIGSDCAFFVEGGTSRCTSRGEIIEPLSDVPGLDLVILYPNTVCPTGPVYAHASSHLTGSPTNCYLVHVLKGDVDRKRLASVIFNRLQESALRVSPGLHQAWSQTGALPGVLARFVSGSGSSIAFLMDDSGSAASLATSLNQMGLGQAFAVVSLPRGAVWG